MEEDMYNPQASISSGGLAWIVVRFDYDEDLKNALMECAGKGNYRWGKATKTWKYRRTFYNQILEILNSYDYEVADNGAYNKPPAAKTPRAIGNPWAKVFDSMDEELGHKLYRAVVQVVHPDKGGDTVVMQLVNDAWAEKRK